MTYSQSTLNRNTSSNTDLYDKGSTLKGKYLKTFYGTVWGRCGNSIPETSLRKVEIYETCLEYSPPPLPVPSLPF